MVVSRGPREGGTGGEECVGDNPRWGGSSPVEPVLRLCSIHDTEGNELVSRPHVVDTDGVRKG